MWIREAEWKAKELQNYEQYEVDTDDGWGPPWMTVVRKSGWHQRTRCWLVILLVIRVGLEWREALR
jgi:hypothetical protein